MAIYEYLCPVCGVFEVFQRMSEAPLTKCPKCSISGRDEAVQRLISAPAFHLKGNGWYKTDYSSTSNGSASNGESSNKKTSEGVSKDLDATATKKDHVKNDLPSPSSTAESDDKSTSNTS